MESPSVNIYIETTVHGPTQKGGRYKYILEKPGNPNTKDGDCDDLEETEIGLVLLALNEALDRMKYPCEVTVYSRCGLLFGAVESGWLDSWRQQGWKNTKGKEISYRERWQKLSEKLEMHKVFIDRSDSHTFRNWMQGQLMQQNDRYEN